ncbi:MAG TPA: class I SAM-dependent methyltransferase [Solirubrobacterales bacterium]
MNRPLHWNPETYLDEIRAEIPRYDELQQAAIDAIPFPPERVLELGFGTAETTRRIWERYPNCRISGLDASPEMVFHARQLGWEEMRLGRIEDPLPDGPWDLVISVLTIHELDDERKRDLFRRVREQSRSLVIGDIVAVPPERRVAPLTEGVDMPAAARDLAAWCDGEVVWEADDLAVVRATYG